MALLLQEKFEGDLGTSFDLDGVNVVVPIEALDTVVSQFNIMCLNTSFLNELDFTSRTTRT